MENFQFAGLAIILAGAIPCFFLARHIEKHKHWTLFTGWDPSKILDEDAYGRLLCKGLRESSIVFAVGGALIFLNLISGDLQTAAVVILPALPLVYYMMKARKLYGKKSKGSE